MKDRICHRCGKKRITNPISQDGVKTCLVCWAIDRANGRDNWNLSAEGPWVELANKQQTEIEKKRSARKSHKQKDFTLTPD